MYSVYDQGKPMKLYAFYKKYSGEGLVEGKEKLFEAVKRWRNQRKSSIKIKKERKRC
jgi:hypothetical protein